MSLIILQCRCRLYKSQLPLRTLKIEDTKRHYSSQPGTANRFTSYRAWQGRKLWSAHWYTSCRRIVQWHWFTSCRWAWEGGKSWSTHWFTCCRNGSNFTLFILCSLLPPSLVQWSGDDVMRDMWYTSFEPSGSLLYAAVPSDAK